MILTTLVLQEMKMLNYLVSKEVPTMKNSQEEVEADTEVEEVAKEVASEAEEENTEVETTEVVTDKVKIDKEEAKSSSSMKMLSQLSEEMLL